MKLKLVVASMSVLGLISCPAFAAAQAKHKHHVAKRHHQMVSHADYKAMGTLVQPTVVEACPINDPFTVALDVMSHNTGRAKPTEGCNKLLSMAGGLNIDSAWGNRGMGYNGENYERVALNDAYLNLFGNVNEWVKAFASISYSDTTRSTTVVKSGQYSNAYDNADLNLEQGFIRVANFDQSPLFLQIGKQFQDFGRYNIHPIQRSMTQSLTETSATSAELGFLTAMGFHGDVYAFSNPMKQRYIATVADANVQGHSNINYGVSIGFDQMSDQQLMYGVNVGYLYSMTAVNDVMQAISQTQGKGNTGGSYYNRVGATAIDAMIGSGPFSLTGNYVAAMQDFSVGDLSDGKGNAAKPWAGSLQAGFNFNAFSKNQNVYLGYQKSHDSVNAFLPESRWLVGYNVDAWKSLNVGVEVGHDVDYSVANGGTGNTSNTVNLRAGVKFG